MSGNEIPTSKSFIRADEYRQQMADEADKQFFAAIREFERIIHQHGAKKVLDNMAEESYWSLRKEMPDEDLRIFD